MTASVKQQLAKLERQLVSAPKIPILNTGAWRDSVPGSGGVYVIWDRKRNVPRYVGETCHLNHRCKDLGRTVNHTFRKKMAAQYKMADHTDEELSRRIAKDFLFSFLVVDLGRKELEEYLVLKWKKTIINKPPKRLLLRTGV